MRARVWTRTVLALVTASLTLATAGVAAAVPRSAQEPVVVVDGLRDQWPQFTVGSSGEVYALRWISESEGVSITRYDGGTSVDIVTGRGGVGGLSADRGVVSWLEDKVLYQRSRDGHIRALADVQAYEQEANPDAGRSYGLRVSDLDVDCLELIGSDIDYFRPRPAGTESHPVGTATTRTGTYVIDHIGGTVLHVGLDGTVRTAAVLPVATVTVDEGVASLYGLPECVVGARWDAQRQPTDVEIGPRGEVYVVAPANVTHFGQPGDALYRLDPRTGDLRQIASGFEYLGSIAVAPDGTVYVAHGKFGESLERVAGDGTVTSMRSPGFQSGIEWANGHLYAGVNRDDSGQASVVVRFKPVPWGPSR